MFEAGSGSKDANYVINNILIHLQNSGFNGHQVLCFLHDCASVERNAYIAALMQFLVDCGICRAAMATYYENNHGKGDVDRAFGVMEKRFNKSNAFSLDMVALTAEAGKSGVTGRVTSENRDVSANDTMRVHIVSHAL